MAVCEILGKFPSEVEALPFSEFCRMTAYLNRRGQKLAIDRAKAGKGKPAVREPKRKGRKFRGK